MKSLKNTCQVIIFSKVAGFMLQACYFTVNLTSSQVSVKGFVKFLGSSILKNTSTRLLARLLQVCSCAH